MKRVRRKETKHQRYLKKSKKQRDESDAKDLFSRLPLDLKTEILLKLPPNSLAKLILASKLWSTILRGKDFTELYWTLTSFRPRFLFAINGSNKHFFQSCPQEHPSADHHHHHRVSITKKPNSQHKLCSPVGGLICYRYGRTYVVIGNPFTGQFVTLPRITTLGIVSTYFGYDPVNDLYKVLYIAAKDVLKNPRSLVVSESSHQVFTLGAEIPKWRKIKSKHPHLPCQYFKGLCKNGVVYYFAWINNENSLMSFDLRSEEFNVIKLPEDVKLLNLDNQLQYNGKIALTSRLCNGTFEMRVLEDARKHEWSKVSVMIPSWTDLVGSEKFRFRGGTSTGQLIFAPYNTTFPNQSYILCYDLKENNVRKVLIEGTENVKCVVEVFFDLYESPMILPKIR